MKRNKRFNYLMLLFVIIGIFSDCTFVENRQREIKLSTSVPEIEKSREVKILSVFFGLDNSLPLQARIFSEYRTKNDFYIPICIGTAHQSLRNRA